MERTSGLDHRRSVATELQDGRTATIGRMPEGLFDELRAESGRLMDEANGRAKGGIEPRHLERGQELAQRTRTRREQILVALRAEPESRQRAEAIDELERELLLPMDRDAEIQAIMLARQRDRVYVASMSALNRRYVRYGVRGVEGVELATESVAWDAGIEQLQITQLTDASMQRLDDEGIVNELAAHVIHTWTLTEQEKKSSRRSRSSSSTASAAAVTRPTERHEGATRARKSKASKGRSSAGVRSRASRRRRSRSGSALGRTAPRICRGTGGACSRRSWSRR